LNLPANVYIYYRKDFHAAGEQLVAWKAENLWRYEPCVDDITGLIVTAKYNAQTALEAVLALVTASVQSIALNYAMFVNPNAMNAVKTIHIHIWWHC